ncbi:MAG: 50S ribosomal protein L24 [Candidatus Nealsonbacteria bacterium]|nr:50S ribosomal protein L24 [Candidatus Nealsonbacteria bacterium]
MKIKKGDKVLIISGKDKGRSGKIVRALPKEDRVVVEGINLRKKHNRPKKSGEKGQIVEMPVPFNVSNVKLICPKCGKPARVEYKTEGGKKYRICKKCNQEI